MNFDGKVTLPSALEIVTNPSSNGCLNASNTERWNSGNSSMNKTPLCANEISPGLGTLLPPISPTCDVVWCGLRNGLFVISVSFPNNPEML